ncbi:AAA family ATPase [Streptomyces sp. NPDC002088]|uniref:AAA family ATPase n=1 Tax=Streptomyces sp. NPDC002088 TaxID=3154665 RepID=UPI003320CE56
MMERRYAFDDGPARYLRSARVGTPDAIVLHGPAGVGKSALAARFARLFTRAGLRWVPVGETSDARTALLRLLAQTALERREIVTAALDRDEQRLVQRMLSQLAPQTWRRGVIVLDAVQPDVGLRLLPVLREAGTSVLITSREKDGWESGQVQLHEVRPLGRKAAEQLATAVATRQRPGRDTDTDARRRRGLVRAAGGIPALLRIAGAMPPEVVKGPGQQVTDPDELVSLALATVPVDTQVLSTVVAQPQVALTTRMVEAMVPAARAPGEMLATLRTLAARELVRETRDEVFEVPSPTGDIARRLTPDGAASAAEATARLRTAAEYSLELATAPLSGKTAPTGSAPPVVFGTGELLQDIDTFMELAVGAPPRQAQSLGRALGTLLSVRGDAHRLVALHWSLNTPATWRALAETACALGSPLRTARLLTEEHNTPETGLDRAAAWYQSGRLSEAMAVLDEVPVAAAVDAARHLMLRGAVTCDLGRPREALDLLGAAVEAHRSAGFPRGRGWSLFHLARAHLLLGEHQHAGHALRQADQVFNTVGDARGRNWVATEEVRVHLLRGDNEKALSLAQRALTAHHEAGDIRGMGWTCHYLTLVDIQAGHVDEAQVAQWTAGQHFKDCEDELGAAWARHRLVVLAPDHDVTEELGAVLAAFGRTGCALGVAWTLLELALRSRGPLFAGDMVSTAEKRFLELGDRVGLAWAATIRAKYRLRPRSAAASAWEPAESLLHRLREDEAEFDRSWRPSPDGTSHARIPLRAREVVAPMAPDPSDALAPPVPASHVRLTLLDESPDVHGRRHILLRVVPEPDHPWATGIDERPWLTAVAVPLTHATIEPATALLRPSAKSSEGAEFAFTPNRPGLHRIRFTIALERTGTVLQQIETEIDILETHAASTLAAPHATTARRR